MRAVVATDRDVSPLEPAPVLPLGGLDRRRVGLIPFGEELVVPFDHAAEKLSHPSIVRIDQLGIVPRGERAAGRVDRSLPRIRSMLIPPRRGRTNNGLQAKAHNCPEWGRGATVR